MILTGPACAAPWRDQHVLPAHAAVPDRLRSAVRPAAAPLRAAVPAVSPAALRRQIIGAAGRAAVRAAGRRRRDDCGGCCGAVCGGGPPSSRRRLCPFPPRPLPPVAAGPRGGAFI